MSKKLSEILSELNTEELDSLLQNINDNNVPKETKKAVKEKVFSKTEIKKYPQHVAFFNKNKLALVASCLCIIFVFSIGALIKPKDNGFIIPQTSSTKFVGDAITGKQEIFYENKTDSVTDATNTTNATNSQSSSKPLEFSMRNATAVAQVKVLEVTNVQYIIPNRFSNESFIIAKLSVEDLICGAKIPQEIYLKVPYYTAEVFEGFDSFICSFVQVGAENFMAINQTKKRVEYFSNMFELAGVNDLGYGSAIAYKNGRVDVSFWDKVTYINKTNKFILGLLDNYQAKKFPATYGTTIDKTKQNILNIVAKESYDFKNNRYILLEDVFSNIDEKEIKEYILPASHNIWKQECDIYSNKITFTRVINGFLTEEVITITINKNGRHTVEKSDVHYDINKLESVVDIGYALHNLDISAIQPKHINSKKMNLQSIEVKGFYRKINEKIYGIIRVKWTYDKKYDRSGKEVLVGLFMDDTYLVYDETGNGVRLERNNFNKMFGEDNGVSYKFDYDN